MPYSANLHVAKYINSFPHHILISNIEDIRKITKWNFKNFIEPKILKFMQTNHGTAENLTYQMVYSEYAKRVNFVCDIYVTKIATKYYIASKPV